ncbi:MAG: hypothetical protein RI958_2279 [Actinomycetota bacterium]
MEQKDNRADGRVARRFRSGAAVMDAMVELIAERGALPSHADIATRAGVSVRSVYLYLGDAEFMTKLIARNFAKHYELFSVPQLGEGTLDERIQRLVTARVTAVVTVGPLIRTNVALFDTYPDLRRMFDRQRHLLRRQTRAHFAAELDNLDADESRLDALDAFTQIDTILYYLDYLGRTPAHTIESLGTTLHQLLGQRPTRGPRRAVQSTPRAARSGRRGPGT